MELFIKIILVVLFALVIVLFIKKSSPHIAILISASILIVILLALSDFFKTVVAFINEIKQYTNIKGEVLEPLIKCVAISILVKIGSDIAKDSGENTIASVIEISASIIALTIALPLFSFLLSMF